MVVPNAFANAEADANSGTFWAPTRLLEVYAASEFPPAPISITEIRFRPDATQAAFTATLRARLSLSTTAKAPDGLSTVFADNIGADETVVFDGDASVSSAAVGTPAKDFDVAFPLARPFVYDPSKGNLLLEIRAYSPSYAFLVDASSLATDNASRAINYSGDANATYADRVQTWADIVEFVHSDEAFNVAINPAGGTFTNAVEVSLSTTLLGVDIWYSLDNSEPQAGSSPHYTGPLRLHNSATLRARAYCNGVAASPIASATFNFVMRQVTGIIQAEDSDEGGEGSATTPPARATRGAVTGQRILTSGQRWTTRAVATCTCLPGSGSATRSTSLKTGSIGSRCKCGLRSWCRGISVGIFTFW